MNRRRFLFTCGTFMFLGINAPLKSDDAWEINGRAMGTRWRIKALHGLSPTQRSDLKAAIEERLETLERIFSTYRPTSEISRFNRSRNLDWQLASPEMVEVARISRDVNRITQGAFDPTLYPLIQLWGFDSQRQQQVPPSAESVAAARQRVGYSRLETQSDPPALRKKRTDLEVDFSSSAKGYAVDEVVALLHREGLHDHLVQIGGDLRVTGNHITASTTKGWRVGIERLPASPSTNSSSFPPVSLELLDRALSTSGNYRNTLAIEGQSYGHIFDPRTGTPVMRPRVSVSVVHTSSAFSSALATGLYALPPDEALRLAEENHLACLVQEADTGQSVLRMTSAFQRLTSPP
ncbi:MAG TPA: FAD:protein FMN transferase [Opitutaceae bacterium]|nr:FAD:protein FMN transferase [Opitutaceae bacterium]